MTLNWPLNMTLTASQVNTSVAGCRQSVETQRHVLGDRAGRPSADGPTVQARNPNDLRGGAGEEHLIRRVEVVAVQGDLLHGVTRITRQLHHGVPRHAAENATPRWRRAQRVVGDG